MPVPPLAVHRTIIAVDVEGFGDRHRINPHQVAVRKGLYQALQQAFSEATIPWSDCYREDRGDGVLILAPPEVAKSAFVESLPNQLVEGLREHNSTHPVPEQIRLRMALHAGELQHDEHGVTGASINLTFRLLDTGPFKTALAGSPGVLALITSSWFFDEVVRHSPAADPDAYRRVRVTVKETDAVGWVHLPDHPYPSRDIALSHPRLVAKFCAELRQLQEGSGLDRAALARKLDYSRSQLDEILDGGITRPPEWDRLVAPLVRECTGGEDRAIASWRRRHAELVKVYSEIERHDRQDNPPEPLGPARAVPARLPADVDLRVAGSASLAMTTSSPAKTTSATAARDWGWTVPLVSVLSAIVVVVAVLFGVSRTSSGLRPSAETESASELGEMPIPNCPTCAPGGKTFTEQVGGGDSKPTFRDPRGPIGRGPEVQPGQQVEVVCRFNDPNADISMQPGWFYLLASPPWNRQYYSVANSYLNGDSPELPSEQRLTLVDIAVPVC